MPMSEKPLERLPEVLLAQPPESGPDASSGDFSARRPIYLLADSRLLFAQRALAESKSAGSSDGPSLLDRLRSDLPSPSQVSPLKAAYLGASNGDEPAFYDIFEAAMDLLEISVRRHIPAQPTQEDLDFLDQAHLVLLAGGDVGRGWRAFKSSGTKDRIERRYREGALLVGISAGAVQLGQGCVEEGDDALLETFGLLPFLIDAHAEPEWNALRRALALVPPTLGGLGIPFGGGAIIAPDMTVEPIAKSVFELFRHGDLENESVREAILLPTPTVPISRT